ncbi:hypothetical protein EVAR_77937_1 [Eumeta japonica]|uniref:Uncharacterized protein n=1 Tax=Eumeta variegata TaxID=151549 RepID=A0A4C1XT31_EUMVA|nr:hypothetical protein EVAR_77937_1 [Eumeta japonica]
MTHCSLDCKTGTPSPVSLDPIRLGRQVDWGLGGGSGKAVRRIHTLYSSRELESLTRLITLISRWDTCQRNAWLMGDQSRAPTLTDLANVVEVSLFRDERQLSSDLFYRSYAWEQNEYE